MSDFKYEPKTSSYYAILSDGTPVYFQCARGSCKSSLQLEIYRKLWGISDEEWADMKREVAEKMGCVGYDE